MSFFDECWHLHRLISETNFQRAGLLFAAMAVVSFVGVMPASFVADKLGRKWTIMPSCLGLAGALLLMAVTGLWLIAASTISSVSRTK